MYNGDNFDSGETPWVQMERPLQESRNLRYNFKLFT